MNEDYLQVLQHHHQVETGHTNLMYLAAVYGIKDYNSACFMEVLKAICVRAAKQSPEYIENNFNDFLNTVYAISGVPTEELNETNK
jgi:hypothetical protein